MIKIKPFKADGPFLLTKVRTIGGKYVEVKGNISHSEGYTKTVYHGHPEDLNRFNSSTPPYVWNYFTAMTVSRRHYSAGTDHTLTYNTTVGRYPIREQYEFEEIWNELGPVPVERPNFKDPLYVSKAASFSSLVHLREIEIIEEAKGRIIDIGRRGKPSAALALTERFIERLATASTQFGADGSITTVSPEMNAYNQRMADLLRQDINR